MALLPWKGRRAGLDHYERSGINVKCGICIAIQGGSAYHFGMSTKTRGRPRKVPKETIGHVKTTAAERAILLRLQATYDVDVSLSGLLRMLVLEALAERGLLPKGYGK